VELKSEKGNATGNRHNRPLEKEEDAEAGTETNMKKERVQHGRAPTGPYDLRGSASLIEKDEPND